MPADYVTEPCYGLKRLAADTLSFSDISSIYGKRTWAYTATENSMVMFGNDQYDDCVFINKYVAYILRNTD